VNQDDVVSKITDDQKPREAFLHALRESLKVKSTNNRFVFCDKVNVTRQHRLDILHELRKRKWFKKGHRSLLVEYVHESDPISHGVKDSTVGRRYGTNHINLCVKRVKARGEAHHTLRASSPNLTRIVERMSRMLERPSAEELNAWTKCVSLDVALGPIDQCMVILKELEANNSIDQPAESYKPKLEKAWEAISRAEQSWKESALLDENAQEPGSSCEICGSVADLTQDLDDTDSQLFYCQPCWTEWEAEKEQDAERRAAKAQGLRRKEGEGQKKKAPSGPQPIYWSIVLSDISKRISTLPDNLMPVEDPHVTLLYIGGKDDATAAQRLGLPLENFQALRDALEGLEGEVMKVKLTKIAIETDKIAVAVVEFIDPIPCAQENPHITLAVAENCYPSYANKLLEKIKEDTLDSSIAVVNMPGGGRVLEGPIKLVSR